MRFVVFYFSGTGNTKWAAEQFCQLAQKEGHETAAFSIEKNACPNDELLIQLITDAEAVGFATPIYGANLPPIVESFIEHTVKLTQGLIQNEKRVFFINTVGYVNAFGPIRAGKLLNNGFFRLVGYVNIRMSNNISTPKLKSNIEGIETLSKRKEQAVKTLGILVCHMGKYKRYITGIGPYLLPGIVIGRKTKGAIEKHYLSLGVDSGFCTHCMLCVQNCPTQSITYDDNSFQFQPTCTVCMRCYNFCPKAAITIDGKYADPNEYKRYHGPGK